jgi:hypothetical protein
MANYSKRCRDCGRPINIRQMPHGQWVAFEGEDPHKCDSPSSKNRPHPKRNDQLPVTEPIKPFEPIYPSVPEPLSGVPNPPPHLPQPEPQSPQPTRPDSRQVTNSERTRPAPEGSPLPTTPAEQSVAPPTRMPNWFRSIRRFIAGLLGSTFGLFFLVLTVLSLPLNVVAVMHLTGWSWFAAFVGVAIFSFIPLIGQIGYLILGVMGAYYIWAANLDWQKAAYPPTQTFSVATLSDSELERFKLNVVRPSFEQACKKDALKTSSFEGKLPERIANRCDCLAGAFASATTRDDLVAYEQSGEYSAETKQRIGVEVRRACPN